MAKRKVNKNKNKKNRFEGVKALATLMTGDKAKFIIGVLFTLLGFFVMIALISFFFTGANDQSKILNKSFFKLVLGEKISVANWTGAGGAFISEQLINNSFGIVSLFIPLFIMCIGARLMEVSRPPLLKYFILLFIVLFFGSITASFTLGKAFSDTFIRWGGAHGDYFEEILEKSIGWPGLLILILLVAISVGVVLSRQFMIALQSIMIKSSKRNKGDVDNVDQEDWVVTDATYSGFEDEISEDDKPKKIKWWRKLFSFLFIDKEPEGDEVNDNSIDESSIEDDVVFDIATTIDSDSEDDEFQIIVPEEEAVSIEYNEPNENENEKVVEDISPVMSPDPLISQIEEEELEDYDPKLDLSRFEFPSLNLLKIYNTSGTTVNMEEQNENKNKIISTLRNYGIEIISIKATVGPTITLYEIVPQAGIRISKIRNLEDDIALSLSALGIRIIAPMPGKGTVGIEVPNKDPQIVSMQSVIASKRFKECTYDLPVALGKTITNEIFMFDLCKMPHLLVAGATGQGKSVGLNAIITSLLYKKHPSEMKMVLVDPKMVEFNIYSTIEKHYLAKLPDEDKAIITDVSKVTQTLNSLTKEMDDRYELLMKAHVRNIKEYNEKFIKRRLNPNKGHKYLPYIVVVIDEFGDLIMTAGKEIEMPIARIAQKARAVGMHMVIATQRPTTNIITGTIKANFPARMAFRVTSAIDSRTILDMAGANQLIGRGDMLFSQGSDLVRIQCAFVDTPEVEGITQYIGKQQGFESAHFLPESLTESTGGRDGGMDSISERDPLFEDAARLIVIHQQGSTSLIQRKFSIGYNRAGRLMDQLETSGIVGSTQGSKPREVLVSDEYHLEKLFSNMN